MMKRNFRSLLCGILLWSLLLSLFPLHAGAEKLQEPALQPAAVSVPAISAPFTTHPTVFIVEDTYQIAFATNATGIAWVEIGGVKYEDAQNGLLNWNSKYHKITVPQAVLNVVDSYKICFRSLADRPTYDAAPGSTVSRTYPFDPIPQNRDPVFFCASDQHASNAYAPEVAKYKAFDVYVFGGDFVSTLTKDSEIKLFLDMTGSVTQGRKPTIYARGNHEIRGSQCHNLERVSGYSEKTGAYYTVQLPGIFGIVLDAGEDKVDSHEAYGGTVQFTEYRTKQTEWLKEVVASREWEKYPVRMAFCHVPFSYYATDTFETVYSQWTELLDQMGISLMISGHTHKYAIQGPSGSRQKSDPNYTVLIMSDKENGDYLYSGSFVTVTDTQYKVENVLNTKALKATATIPIFTNAYVNTEADRAIAFPETDGSEEVAIAPATRATVPSITSPYTLHPTVFAVEDGYQIIFTTNTTGLAWVEVGGKKYYDVTTGNMNWASKYHSIRVPRVALDTARSYKTCFQSLSDRAAYYPAPGSTVSRTYPFTPMGDKKEPVILCLTDFRNLNAEAKAVAQYKAFDALYIGGDYVTHGNTEANVKLLLDTASAITTGTKPVIYARGNREVRGAYSYLLDQISPTSSTGKSYYTIEQPDLFGIVLDTGEDKVDSDAAYGSTVAYEKFRQEQTQWLKEVLAEGKWKDYPTRIAFCQMPITTITTAAFRETYAQWTELLDQMGISLMITGNKSTYNLYAPDNAAHLSSPSFAVLTTSDVDNATYKYSGSFVTLGTSTLKIENVSAQKKLLRTSTTPNLTANNFWAQSDSYLMFDFNNDSVAQERYRSAAYGGINFDTKTNWFPETNTGSPAMSRGVLSFSPASATVTSSGVHSRPQGSVKNQWAYKPLHHTPKATDYCQIRFKIDGAVSSQTDGTAKFRLDLDCFNDIDDAADVSKTYVRFEQSFKAADVIGKGYVTISFPLNTAQYLKMDFVNLVHPQFVNLKSASGTTAVFSIDYLYIGPQSSFPKQESHLFFDFTDTAEDQARYDSFTYNYLNFDNASNWSAYTGSPMVSISDGALRMAVPQGNEDGSYSARSRGGDVSMLHFVPGKEDYVQVRIKIDNAVATTADGTVTFRMNLDRTNAIVNAEGTSRTWTNIPISFKLEDYVDKGWFTLETKLTDAEYLASDWINLVHPQFLNMKSASGKNAAFYIDYIYIGPKGSNPADVTVTFAAEDGSILQTSRTARGSAVVYEGAIPTKAPTDESHYSFLGWADEAGAPADLTAVMASMTLKPMFQEEAHSFTYSNIGEQTHTAYCGSCNTTLTEGHSFTEGLCPCGKEESKEPILDNSLEMGHTLNLASDISVNFAVSKSLLEGFDMDTVYVLTEMDTYEGNIKTGTTTVKLLPVDRGYYYYFTLTGLTAVQMNDRLTSVLYGTKNGQPYYSATDDYSIADYAYSQMDKETMPDTLKVLCADLLRYGASAQIFKNYRTNALADAAMTAAHRAYLSDMEAVTFGNHNRTLNDLPNPTITWAGKSLNLESKVALKFVFSTASYSGNLEDLNLRVSYTNIEGKTVTTTVDDVEIYNAALQQYAFSFDGLLAAELRSVVSVQVYEKDTPVSPTLEYSADTYGNNRTGTLLTLCKALFAYSDSAEAYFTS